MRHVRPVLLWSIANARRSAFGWGNSKGNSSSSSSGGDNSNNNTTNNTTNYNGSNNIGGGYVQLTEFVGKAAALKRRHRGRGQYEFARREAEKFLQEEVPRTGTNVWMEKGTNALALSQLLSFFEIEPEPSLLALITNKLLRLLDDTNIDSHTRLQVAIALSSRSELYMERIFATVDDVLKQAKRDVAYNDNSGNFGDVTHKWNVIELSAKVLQRNGKHAPSLLNESLTQMVIAQLERTPTNELPILQSSLLRVYSWMVRTGKVAEANHLLVALVEHTGEFHSYDFATLMSSCLRHHQFSPLPLPLLHRMARVGLMYSTLANGRDVAAILASIARMLGSLEAGKNGVTQRDVGELGGRMSMLLEEYEPRVLRFLDSNDDLYWKHCDDITSIAFAYEMGGRLRYRHVFLAYQSYVAQNVTCFEPQQLAIASGILRRSHLLSRELAMRLGERIETVLGEFSLSEISHICSTFAPISPSWMPEAKAVATRLLVPNCSSYTKLTLSMAFPDDEALQSQINYKEISGRQLVDAMTLAKGIKFEGIIVAELTARLNAAQERFSPDDLRMVQASGRQELLAACMMYLSSRFAEAEWTADTLYSLPLASGIPHARDPVKALAAAKAVSISPEQFVSLVEILTSVFGEDSDEAMVNFVVTGGEELVSEEKVQLRTVLRYLEAVRPIRKLHPRSEWLAIFNEKMLRFMRSLGTREMRSLLWSLQEVYGNVAQQPLLQQTLTEVVTHAYGRITQPDEEAAKFTLLIAHIQYGMPNPPLTASTPLAVSVKSNAATYPAEVRDAVMNMSLPQEAQTKQVGRFTLRAVRALATPMPTPPTEPQSHDVNAALDADPFATPLRATASDATTTGTATLSPPQQQQSQPLSQCNVGAMPAFSAKDVSPAQMTKTTGSQPAATTEAYENATRTHTNGKQEQTNDSASAPPSATHSGNTASAPSGMRRWNLFGTAPDTSMKPREPVMSAPPVAPQQQPPEESRAADSHTGSSYMKLFDSSRLSNAWHDMSQQELHGGDMINQGNSNTIDEQLRPRRTGLPRVDKHGSSTGIHTPPAAKSSLGYDSPQFSYDGWNTSPNAAITNAPPTSGWASPWSVPRPSMAPAQGNHMGGQNATWLSPQMQPPARAFGGNGNSFGVNTQHQQQLQQQQQQQQQQQTQQKMPQPPPMNTSMMQQHPQQHQQQHEQEPQQQQPQQQQQQQGAPSAYRMAPRGGVASPGNHLFIDPASSSRPRPVITKKNSSSKAQQSVPSSSLDEDINQMYAKNAEGPNEGVSNFMKKAGLTKITGYNMGSTDGETTRGDQKGFWADLINQSVRRTKGESRRTNKKPNRLSEWLDAPPTRAVTAARKGRLATPSAPAAKGKSKPKEKRGNGKEHTPLATAPTLSAKPTTAARGKGANAKASLPKTARGTSAKAPAAKVASKGAAKSTSKAAVAKPKKQPENNNHNNININNNKKVVKKRNEKKPVMKKAAPVTSSVAANAKNKTPKKTKSSSNRKK
ncbi:hypothetical protein C4B63_11g32 [Trypanosoma cruzi]|uniref:Uncharacterized protein n=1 Tax=Trypanosoma cruzi TaxID=5693 RepID=A0A2V2VQG3_TRYCR|nr:hypothetical protein C4B63_11g32 [Trypanosoma cruzi]